MRMNYYLMTDDEKSRPLTATQIRLRLRENTCNEQDLVKREDQTKWVPLHSLEEFRDAIAKPRPLENPMAQASLVLGIISVPLVLLLDTIGPLPLVWLTSIPAIIAGNLAIRKIGRTPRAVHGYGVAKAGLWLGFLTAFIVPLIVLVIEHTRPRVSAVGNMTKAISNCRQVITVLRIYASDHNGNYPDAVLPGAVSSNEIFRQLFKDEDIDTEMIFGSPSSVFKPDGNIGSKPDFLDAVKLGENHWAFTKGLTDSSPGDIPLVFENPSDASWPPKWNPDSAGTGKPGRTWKGGKVVIGYNDSSVGTESSVSPKGTGIELKAKPGGNPVFPARDPRFGILNVEK